MKPLISIVTPSLNQSQFLREALESVRDQQYPAIEHIVLDGCSTDGSQRILQDFEKTSGVSEFWWRSASDEGQSAALNEGFARASGEIVGWLNADDRYRAGCFQAVAAAFAEHPELDVLYGDYNLMDAAGNQIAVRREIEFSRFILRYHRVLYIPTTATFFRRRVFERGHTLSSSLHYAMDLEFFLRLADAGCRFQHLPEVLADFRVHPASKSVAFRSRQRAEHRRVVLQTTPLAHCFHSPGLRNLAAASLQIPAALLRYSEKTLSRVLLPFLAGNWTTPARPLSTGAIMKVLLAALSSSPRPDGVLRHAANLAHSIARHANVERVDLVCGTWQREALTSLLGNKEDRILLSAARASNTSLSRNYWHWSGLPKLAAALQSDIVHMAYPVPINRRAFSCPTVVTLHDLYPYDIPANFGYPRVLVNRMILQQCLRSVDSIACVSDSTMQRLEVDLPTSIVEKATMIYNSVASKNIFGTRDQAPFFLCVAQHRRNKNIPLAIHLLRRLIDSADIPHNTRLLIVGTDGPETPVIKRLIRKMALEANVLLLQGVSDERLNRYYSQCELLIATSTIEGFGLPIVEAMQHRCRVVCSDIPAFREVGGSYCDYVPLGNDNVTNFAMAVRATLKDKRFRTAETDRFSPALVGRAYLSLYNGLIQAAEQRSSGGRQSPLPALERGRP